MPASRSSSDTFSVEAYEGNLEALVAYMAEKWSPGAVTEMRAGSFFRSGLNSFPCNVVWRTRLSYADAPAAVQEVTGILQEHGLPAMWLTGPSSSPPGLGDILAGQGFQRVDQQCMTLRLQKAPVPGPRLEVPGLTITEVLTDEALLEYGEAYGGFGFDAETLEGKVRLLRAAGYGPGHPIRHFVGYVGRVPVACSSVCCFAGVAGVYWVATLNPFRGRGIGAALTEAACEAGREEGYDCCVLGSSKLGAPVYRRLGFRDTGLFRMHTWRPQTRSPARDEVRQ